MLSEFCANGVGGGCGVGCFEDRASDDDVIGACGGGLSGSEDAFLFVAGAAGGADAGGDKYGVAADGLAHGGDFEGGADEALDAGLTGHASEVEDLCFGWGLYVDLSELLVVHGGENGDAEEMEMGRVLGACFFGPADHFGAAGCVEGEHFDGERGDALDGFGDGVGDVVQFEIEKDAMTAVGDLADEVGPVGGEELEPDFDPLDGAVEAVE